jgi:CRP-like cAMP-binding protein
MVFSNIKVFFPWTYSYKLWWSLTAMGALWTAMLGPYSIAYHDRVFFVEEFWTLIFLVDILVNFNLAFYRNEILVLERSKIVQSYMLGSRMFWIDLLGILPLDTVALYYTLLHHHVNQYDDMDQQQQQVQQAQLLSSLFRLVRLVRLHRLKPLSDVIQYNPRISLMWFTLLRNFAVFWFATHFSACTMYFLARLHGFGDDTWLGPLLAENEEHGITMSGYDRYMVALYWSVVTFVTVGYGDFVAVNAVEQTWASVFMFASIVVNSWIIGSITLLVVKGDEKTGEYRDSLQVLNQYSALHEFDDSFTQKLRKQLRLEFYNRETADEQVLKHFPSAMRRKVLRKLYWQPLMKTSLLQGVRPQFVDAFLSACSVEIFSPGEEIVQRGSISSDLFLLVGGIAEVTTLSHDDDEASSSTTTATVMEEDGTCKRMDTPNTIDEEPLLASSNNNETKDQQQHPQPQQLLEAGCFVGEIGFFTESPQIDSVSCITVCKTLTMSQSSYQLMAQTHSGSVGRILQNLLRKVEEDMQERRQRHDAAQLLPKALTVLRVGSMYDPETDYGSFQDPIKRRESILALQQEECMTTIHDLVKMHLEKQKDDQTTRLLFAASRCDLSTIRLMCDQGFDANNADYDNRTALMVA